MDGSGGGARGAVEGLTPILRSRALEPADRYQLAVTAGRDGRPRGSVQYLARGAQSVVLRVYTAKGTYVTPMGGELALGSDSGIFRADPSGVSGAYYHTANGKLYAKGEGGWQVFEAGPQGGFGEFQPADEPDPGKLIPFGVCAYASLEGGGSSLLPLTRTAIAHLDVEGQLYCAEEFACEAIPSNAIGIRVELNDLEGSLLSPNLKTSLAWVKIQGPSLTVGPLRDTPDVGVSPSLPERSPEDVSSSKASSSKASSSKASSSKASSKASSPPASPAGGKESGAAASPSTEEALPSSQLPLTRKEEDSRQSESLPALEELASLDPSHAFYPEPDPLLYQVELSPRDLGVDWGIVAYLLLVSGVILYLLLRPPGR